MSFRSSITIVASPRPRVGKTLLARLLADFHRHEGRAVATFDLNAGDKTLEHFLLEQTTTASIRDINGQIALFDRLVADENTTKVVDLGHESFESFFAVTHQIGFLEEASRRGIEPIMMFLIDPDQKSSAAYSILQRWFADISLLPVRNQTVAARIPRFGAFPNESPIHVSLEIPLMPSSV